MKTCDDCKHFVEADTIYNKHCAVRNDVYFDEINNNADECTDYEEMPDTLIEIMEKLHFMGDRR